MIKNRHLELSSKFIEMGQALMNEGKDDKDLIIAQTGSFMILMGGIMFDENDILLFSQLLGMFSAKKILDNMERTNDGLLELLKQKKDSESYEDFIKRINKTREDNGHLPLL